MSLRPLLAAAHDDADFQALVGAGGRAFASPSLRAYLTAAVVDADQHADRPAIVVAADDRGARELAADLRTWLAPRRVRLLPSRGVAYESHLAPPPHLVGLRVAAVDALLSASAGAGGNGDGATDPPVVVVSAVALSEKIPDPRLRPRGFTIERGDLIDLDETVADLVAAGYERVDQVTDRGQFAVRGGLLDLFPATEDRAVRVDLFGDEIESLRWFSPFTQRSLEELDRAEVNPAAELAAEHRELAEIAALEAADERPDVAELLPVDEFRAFFDLAPADAVVAFEAQINATHGDQIRSGSLYPDGRTKLGQFRKDICVMNTAPHKPDEFFTQEVIAEGDHIQIFVNGKKTVDFKDPNNTYTKGHFALQGHDPGSVMTFKKVEYKPLKK